MFIKQLYTGCLSEAAYYLESGKEAAIIDPLRDIDSYLDLAAQRGTKIKYIFETHFHADFVSGHLDLEKATGAPIVYGPGAETNFSVYIAKDQESFRLGDIRIEVLHTPGHTLESACYLVHDEAGKPSAIFTGDTLFVGDVGRPDLSSGNLNKEQLASMLYDSLQQKIIPLPDEVTVYPAHGQGSSCGKNIGPQTHSTIAEQRLHNYAMQPQTREAFIHSVTEGLGAPPEYFSNNARINKEGYESLEEVLDDGMQALDVQTFKNILQQDGFVLLDTREPELFTAGFIPGSINIGLSGRFAEWAGNLIPFDRPILLVADLGAEKESLVRLARVGFDKMKGYLEGGIEKWKKAGEPMDMIINVDPDELVMDIPFDPKILVIDVRRELEFADGHARGAVNIPVSEFADPGSMANIEETQNVYLHCTGGYRSVIACSMLKRQGIHNIRNVTGGWNAIKEKPGIEIVKETSVLN